MYARLAEVIGLDASIAVTLAAHQAIGLKVRCGLVGRMGGPGSWLLWKPPPPHGPAPSLQAPVRGRRLRGACPHRGQGAIPPALGLLPRGLRVSALLLVPTLHWTWSISGQAPRPTAQSLGGFAWHRNRGGGAPPGSAVAPATQLGSGEAAREPESRPEAVAGRPACPHVGAP